MRYLKRCVLAFTVIAALLAANLVANSDGQFGAALAVAAALVTLVVSR